MLWEFDVLDKGDDSSKRFFKMWLAGSLKEHIYDLLAIF